MGGYMSGRSGWRKKVEAQHGVDIRWMKRKGWLYEGCSGTLSWSSLGEQTGSINYKVGRGKNEVFSDKCAHAINNRGSGDKITLSYSHRENGGEWIPVDVQVTLVYTSCNYGGERVWMRCPNCLKRCAKVYLTGKIPACRKCYNLAYYSECETPLDRALRQTRKAQVKLGYDRGCLDEWLPKPKGMHWKTYEQLIKKVKYGKGFLRTEAMRRFNMEI